MHKTLVVVGNLFLLTNMLALPNSDLFASGSPFLNGAPDIQSMSALVFAPDGNLLVGDSKGGTVFALDLKDKQKSGNKEGIQISNIESKLAAMMGTSPDVVLIHDMAVNPLSQNIYLAVSKGRSDWQSRWQLPNDIADANMLLRITPAGEISEVSLKNVRYARAALPNPVDASKTHMWKEGLSLRVDTITDMAWTDGTVYVAGLSNEEFASTLWKVPYPFKEGVTATTVEIFHGAHAKYETHAPIRTFVPYQLKNEAYLLAAYLCTPFVTFKTADLKTGKHLKGRTVAEFGSGNYPLDMIVYQKHGKDYILIANSNLPFMIVDPADIENYEGEIVEELPGYTGGVPYEARSGTGVQQLDTYNDEYVVALQRLPGGTMDLVSMPLERF